MIRASSAAEKPQTDATMMAGVTIAAKAAENVLESQRNGRDG